MLGSHRQFRSEPPAAAQGADATPRRGAGGSHLRAGEGRLLGAAALAAMATAVTLWLLLPLDDGYPLRTAALALSAAVLGWPLLRGPRAPLSSGAANRVTLARAVLVVLILAMPWSDPAVSVAAVTAALATIAAVLDGVDGWVARRTGTSSAFGARFDMETDAALVLALSLLAWQWGQAGPWVLLAGAARYVFAASALVLPWMRRALPPSQRRRVVCVVQVAALIACVAPVLPTPLGASIAAAGVAALVVSFTVDTCWLFARARSAPEQEMLHDPR